MTATPMPVPLYPIDQTAGALIGSAVNSGLVAIGVGLVPWARTARSTLMYFTLPSCAMKGSSVTGMEIWTALMLLRRTGEVVPPMVVSC